MYSKVKGTVPKFILTEEDDTFTQQVVLPTMRRIANIVGATLGPGGRPVLLERQEDGVPPIFTKDGVTVFRALGFSNAAADNVMQAARDVAIRTANEAGDGTTTATVLAEALIRYTHTFCAANRQASPQGIVRRLAAMFTDDMEQVLVAEAVKATPATPAGLELLRAVARVSANGDEALANAVIECLKIIGDEGSVTIIETSGPTGYHVEPLRGYPIPMGYDESCRRWYDKFINDQGHQRCYIERPSFLLYHGRITDINAIRLPMEQISAAWEQKVAQLRAGATELTPGTFRPGSPNVVIVATEFSDNVLGQLALNFAEGGMKVVPLVIPLSPIANGQAQLLHDLAAVTGATLMDPMNKPLDVFDPSFVGPGVDAFEMQRFRSNVIGMATGPVLLDLGADGQSLATSYEQLLMRRIKQVQVQVSQAASIQDGILLRERLAKLTSGIAQLIISGASNGELKERHDRAEDAVCAVRGAIKQGCFPGAGWGLMLVAQDLVARYDGDQQDLDTQIVNHVLLPALEEPLRKLLANAGRPEDQIQAILGRLSNNILGARGTDNRYEVFDAARGIWVDAWTDGLLDSAPAVIEALRNAISMAQLGALGGVVGFYRDEALERQDAAAKAEFLRNANINEADRRP